MTRQTNDPNKQQDPENQENDHQNESSNPQQNQNSSSSSNPRLESDYQASSHPSYSYNPQQNRNQVGMPRQEDNITQPPSECSSLDGNVFTDGATMVLESGRAKTRRSQTYDSITSSNTNYGLNRRFISKNQMKEFREAFRLFDKDNDGSITKEELGTVMRSLGQFARVEELQEMLLEIDVDGDGNVSFEEFVDIMSNMTDTLAETSADQEERELRDAFRVFDKHNRGYITASDLRAVLQCLGEDLDEEEIEDMIKEVDVDGDGRIDFYEFVHALGEPEDSQENDDEEEALSPRSLSGDVTV
ncbi:uncharacterized protein LOC129751739 [Uranotaenia lowii]|uniref:uncharacterized protein LOC129751739 n=1 Tax=Uranotaenia lowii TaxID=190385 RepID=UPI0024797D33|nr:uncharacterized protein LOC129751739 [Uranotaenia lowii]XP_055603389.1 uncharacterized protein LOC129751739 [Uranotaenia lowii]XP_055603390.1 uncharacterized protein LOC129751739 [Uranotaenia lowii]XP_055603391.1 uncharacterized protein LOC129751739 [Uranotaenia lowii]XP_055603392.1 uncharacterized protein LOC129751739 [Uranotaenia lowii]XP_055603394.1 uncharacterized protein LOC129751739 [Uranotaenia lowii]XP_055603395.1 uncharacterized protein LOC129751739 [Uranotaenia lowii]